MIKENNCLQLSKIYKQYPNGKKAVSNLDLTLFNGEIFALLGPNGAGKTSTICMINGL
jgi:ABC-type multidrug transport system ATPase subunit